MHHRPTTHAVLAQFLCLSLLSTCLMVVHLSVVAWPLREYPAGTTGTTRAAWKEWTPPPLPFFLLRQCAVSSYAGSLPLPASVQACSPTITLNDVLCTPSCDCFTDLTPLAWHMGFCSYVGYLSPRSFLVWLTLVCRPMPRCVFGALRWTPHLALLMTLFTRPSWHAAI